MTPLLLASLIAAVGASVGLVHAIIEERKKRKRAEAYLARATADPFEDAALTHSL